MNVRFRCHYPKRRPRSFHADQVNCRSEHLGDAIQAADYQDGQPIAIAGSDKIVMPVKDGDKLTNRGAAMQKEAAISLGVRMTKMQIFTKLFVRG
jgi:hypothetical protein